VSGAVAPESAMFRMPSSWERLARAKLRVRQQYRYAYTSPIHELRQRLMMLPPKTHDGQRLLHSELLVDGADAVRTLSQSDRFGNVVHHVSSPLVNKAVEFTAEFTVERYASGAPARIAHDSSAELYLARTALTAPCARIREAARDVSEQIRTMPLGALVADVLPAGVRELNEEGIRQWAATQYGGAWAAQAIAYEFGTTGVQTPAAMALHLGRGVCQDFAHLAIAILRELGVAVRYVSGHLLGEGAPHAWIEALLPDPDVPGELRVVAYDPTHRARTGLNYITVAVGRDYNDIAPTSGTFQGAIGQFSTQKQAWIVDLE
jgi:transglutaminase-like putative cysteine protease